MSGLRVQRLADSMRDILGSCFTGARLNDPRLQGVSVTSVRLSGDLQIASVYFRSFSDQDQAIMLKGLYSCKGYLRNVLAENLFLRRVPELRFFYDSSIENGLRVEELLHKINNA